MFLDFLAEHFSKMDTYIKLELVMVTGIPQLEMRLQQEHIAEVTSRLCEIYKSWQGTTEELKKRLPKF